MGLRDLNPAVNILLAEQRSLWFLGILFFGIGDLVTTGIGWELGQVVEVGPIVVSLIQHHGLGAMAGLKVVALGCCYVLWRLTPPPHDISVPLALAALGVLLTTWNVALLTVVII